MSGWFKVGLPDFEPWRLEASKGGMKVGRVKDPLYKDSYLGITPPTFTPPLEPFEESPHKALANARKPSQTKPLIASPKHPHPAEPQYI